MPEDSRAFLEMIRFNPGISYTAVGPSLDLLGQNVGLVRTGMEDDMEYRIHILETALGIPKGYLSEKEKPKPKLLTRFQILKNESTN